MAGTSSWQLPVCSFGSTPLTREIENEDDRRREGMERSAWKVRESVEWEPGVFAPCLCLSA